MNTFLSKSEFDELAKKYPYYENRWRYFSEVIGMLKDCGKVLEIGSYMFPLVNEADTADIKGNAKFKVDLDKYPWKFENKEYDTVVALQTLEHLKDKKKAFEEIRRISNKSIISLPLEWDCPHDKEHHGITEEMINEWSGIKPTFKKILDNPQIIILKYDH